MINQDSWLGLAPNVTMLATKGHPMHTGRPVMNRPATNHSEHEGARKALLDFFLLTETDYFVSNCAYTCFGHHCSNTFAYNIHNHRCEHTDDFHDHLVAVVMLIALFSVIYQVANVRGERASSDQPR